MPRRITSSRPITSNPTLDSCLLTPLPRHGQHVRVTLRQGPEGQMPQGFPGRQTLVLECTPRSRKMIPLWQRDTFIDKVPLPFLYTL